MTEQEGVPLAQLLYWLRGYITGTDEDSLLLLPWVNFEAQPACTIGPPWTKVEDGITLTIRGNVTPAQWTRKDLIYMGKTLRKWQDGTFNPNSLDGKLLLHNAPEYYILVNAYRDRVLESQREAKAA